MLLGRSHEDADDLLHDIQEFERIDRERRERFGTAAERRATSDAPRMQPTPKALLQGASGYDWRDQRPAVTNQTSNVTGAVLFNNCGCEILVDMEDGEVIVPVFTSGNDDVVLRKGQRLGHATEVDIPGCEMKKINECREECSAAKPEQILVTEARRPIGSEEMKMGPSVTEEQRRELACLQNEYQDCFAANLSELGCTPALSMDIQEIPGSTPVTVRPYRTNAAKLEAIRDIVGEWKREGIVTETQCEYASPVILVEKKNGEPRVVVYYRRLNAQTIKEKYLLPAIDDQLEGLAGAKLYVVLDLAHGYLQVPLAKEAKKNCIYNS
ncbi:uncharacterized protein LOC119182912 [Rhipicephalus microplus]|uniref:uncharacterized protein LOC119182912 n=1 Tax=Rhipicephalus microplus TaxID=6941 RepID=UPI001888A9C9|nr:uncharacterized protein LOC119182912 [Rhipicephalus microplus]